jgi:hypothetical protein
MDAANTARRMNMVVMVNLSISRCVTGVWRNMAKLVWFSGYIAGFWQYLNWQYYLEIVP